MEYQITSDFKFNLNKNIGKVLYIVEGEKTEITILLKIFKDILKYDQVIYRRRNSKIVQLKNINNSNSVIYILNTKSSNVSTIRDSEYINNQLLDIIKQYPKLSIDIFNIRKYYIFDCDREEDIDEIESLIPLYKNSLGMVKDYEFGGMLLLSYPSIESFIIENFTKESFNVSDSLIDEGNIKEYLNENKMMINKLNIDSLNNAVNEMINALKRISCDKINLDDISDLNKDVYEYEKEKKFRYILSLLVISLFDMGIIEFN